MEQDDKPINLIFREITEDDIPELTAVMTRAFDDDAQQHLGLEKGGPEGYDDLETPSFAIKNHGFYEKCGFQKVGAKPHEDDMPGESWVYRKEIQP